LYLFLYFFSHRCHSFLYTSPPTDRLTLITHRFRGFSFLRGGGRPRTKHDFADQPPLSTGVAWANERCSFSHGHKISTSAHTHTHTQMGECMRRVSGRGLIRVPQGTLNNCPSFPPYFFFLLFHASNPTRLVKLLSFVLLFRF